MLLPKCCFCERGKMKQKRALKVAAPLRSHASSLFHPCPSVCSGVPNKNDRQRRARTRRNVSEPEFREATAITHERVRTNSCRVRYFHWACTGALGVATKWQREISLSLSGSIVLFRETPNLPQQAIFYIPKGKHARPDNGQLFLFWLLHCTGAPLKYGLYHN